MAERKFTSLRKRLDQLGYRQPLGMDSVPLVEKIFSDLIHTTESLKNAKVQLGRQSRNGTSLSEHDSSEPYRSDNAKLVRENNDLHLELIRQKEDAEHKFKDLKEKLRKLEHENSDLKFLNSQYVHKVRALEKDLRSRTEKIQELHEKNLHAVVETPGGRKKQIPYRRQRMDIDSLVTKSETTTTSEDTADDPYIADLLGVADEKIHRLQINVSKAQEEKEATERRNKSLHKQLEARDREIKRLHSQLEGGRPVGAILKDSKQESSDRVIAHLNVQVDYLQQANRDLEQQIKSTLDAEHEATTKSKELREKNDELCAELRRLDKAVKTIEEKSETEQAVLRRQFRELQEDLEEKHQSNLDIQAELHRVRKERESIIDESEKLTSLLTASKEDIKNVSELLERTDKEKRRLQEKNAKLTITERELVMELERLKLSKSANRKVGKSPDRIELLIRNLEDERDHYKDECQILQDMIRKRIAGREVAKSPSSRKGKAHLEGMLELMQEERDFYKREYELMRNLKEKQGTYRSPPTRDKPTDNSNEVSRLRRERDELQSMLEKFERHLASIQSNVQNLTTEKENIQLLYEQATDEIQRLRRQLSRARSPSPSKRISSILERVEKERDEALEEVKRKRSEVQTLENQLNTVKTGQSLERSKYDDSRADLERIIEKIDREKSELHTRVTSLREMVANLEEQLKSTTSSLRNSREVTADKEAEISKLRLLLEQSERSGDELKRRLEKKIGELQKIESDKFSVEELQADLENEVDTLREEVLRLKGMVSSLDRERDLLQQEVDQKAELLVEAESKRAKLERAENDLKINIEELEERLRHKEHDVTSNNREIKSLSKQVRSTEDELAAITRNRDSIIKENKRLQSDLTLMTEENQNVHRDLQDALDDQQVLNAQVSEYASQVARIEDLLAEKEQEKNDLLMQFQTLTNRAEVLETNVQQTTGEASTYRKEILQKEQEISRLKDRCHGLEEEVDQYITAQDAYEQQLSSMAKSLSNMEGQLRQVNQEKETLQQDVNAVRELCVKLDQARDTLTRQLASKTDDESQLQQFVEEARNESENLRRQLVQQQDNVRSMENILSSNREKQFYEQQTHDETLSELDRIRTALLKAERDRDSKDVDVKSLRKTAEKLREEVEHLRKQLTSEKYERERQSQELRKIGVSPKGSTYTSDYPTQSILADRTAKTDYLSSILNYTTAGNKSKESAPPSPVRPAKGDLYSPTKTSVKDYSSDGTPGKGR
ncbi:centrosomal protein of 135 kDa-like [Rhopilema esculentum]|uniref:centrosomal protein of 135 kDa-like n=1 Tax=Rhopilema esculentum TaxID=499914 RepID=UPI0031DAB50F